MKEKRIRYNYNTEFFKTLTENSAYVLGLMYSDGNLNKNSNAFSICFDKKDDYLLKDIAILLRNNEKLSYCRNEVNLICTHKEMYEDLLGWGLYPNKSNTLTVDDRLINNSHFWRGCIDGDGCITIKDTPRVQLCGTKDICNDFLNWCKTIVKNIKVKIRNARNDDKNFFNVTINGLQALTILNTLYPDNINLFLLRKKERHNYIKNNFIFKEIKEKREKTIFDIPRIRAVLQFTKDGTFIKKYNSVKEASVELNIVDSHISSACKGKLKTSGGYKWKYETYMVCDDLHKYKDLPEFVSVT